MENPFGNTTDTWLAAELRHALQHLYNARELRRSPLLGLLDLQGQEAPTALRRLLTEAIETLKPGENISPQATPWRIYRTLCERYIDQFSQREVAAGLGLSIRQMKRLDSLAVRTLADQLCARYHLEPGALDCKSHSGPEATPQGCEQEMRWVERSHPSEAVDLPEIVASLQRIIAPLIQSAGVRIRTEFAPNLPRLAVRRASFRQALLSLLTAAVHAVPNGELLVAARCQERHVAIQLEPRAEGGTRPKGAEADEYLCVSRQLVSLSGGELILEQDCEPGMPFAARLLIPVADQATVLIIDDNADTLRLFQSYLAGTRYPFVGTSDPKEAMALALEVAPRAIVLDVMLPEVDGWELLERLREHPETRQVPVLVCTILPHEQLALALGAAAFLRKPVNRETLLAALDQHLGPPERGFPSAP